MRNHTLLDLILGWKQWVEFQVTVSLRWIPTGKVLLNSSAVHPCHPLKEDSEFWLPKKDISYVQEFKIQSDEHYQMTLDTASFKPWVLIVSYVYSTSVQASDSNVEYLRANLNIKGMSNSRRTSLSNVDYMLYPSLLRTVTDWKGKPSLGSTELFWNTLTHDAKTGVYSFQVDEQWFDLSADLLRKALAITPVNPTVYGKNLLKGSKLIFTHTKQVIKARLKDHKEEVILSLMHLWTVFKANIYYWQQGNNIHRRPDSAVHHTGDDFILGNLKFVPKASTEIRKESLRSNLSDEDDEAQQESIPQEEGDDPDLDLAKKMSLEAHQEKGEGEGVINSLDSTTGPSSQPKGDTSEKVIHESSSTSDSERTESEKETIAPKGDKDLDDQEKSKVIKESDSTIPDPSHQTVTSTPPVIAPFTNVSSTKPSSLVTPPPINMEATTITTSLFPWNLLSFITLSQLRSGPARASMCFFKGLILGMLAPELTCRREQEWLGLFDWCSVVGVLGGSMLCCRLPLTLSLRGFSLYSQQPFPVTWIFTMIVEMASVIRDGNSIQTLLQSHLLGDKLENFLIYIHSPIECRFSPSSFAEGTGCLGLSLPEVFPVKHRRRYARRYSTVDSLDTLVKSTLRKPLDGWSEIIGLAQMTKLTKACMRVNKSNVPWNSPKRFIGLYWPRTWVN
ncbi:hypothetical protein Tco_0475485 [Tanacetum coccineum]